MNEKYLILNNIIDEIVIFSENQEILFLNKAMMTFLDGMDLEDLICSEEKSQSVCREELIRKAFAKEEMVFMIYNQYRSMSAITMDNNTILIQFHNITKLKEIQNELEKTKFEYEAAESLANLGHWELDIINNNLYWSDEIYRIFKIDRHLFNATYEGFLDVIHPEDRERVNKKYIESLDTGESYDIVHRLKFDDGTEKHVHEKCITEFSEKGIPLRSFGLVWDITDLVQNKSALEISEKKLRNFLNAIPQPTIITDKNAIIIDSTYRENHHFGYTHDELIGKKFDIFHVDKETYIEFGYDYDYYEKMKKEIWRFIKEPKIGK